VADWHTYFVGCDEWGFSVWAHNTCFEVVKTADGYRVLTPTGSVHAEFANTPGGRDAAYRLANHLNLPPRPGSPALKWDAHDSIPTFGHTITRHGQGMSRDALVRRAADEGRQVGAWTNNREATRLVADSVRGRNPGDVFEIVIEPRMGRAYLPNGTQVPVDRARIVIGADGSITSSYPFSSLHPN